MKQFQLTFFLVFGLFISCFGQTQIDSVYNKPKTEQAYFNDLSIMESYLVCEDLLDIYYRFNKKELDQGKLHNYLQERNFKLTWNNCTKNIEDREVKIFKVEKNVLWEILKL